MFHFLASDNTRRYVSMLLIALLLITNIISVFASDVENANTETSEIVQEEATQVSPQEELVEDQEQEESTSATESTEIEVNTESTEEVEDTSKQGIQYLPDGSYYDEDGNWEPAPSDTYTLEEILMMGMRRSAAPSFYYLAQDNYAKYLSYTKRSGQDDVSIREKRTTNGEVGYCLDYYKQLGQNQSYVSKDWSDFGVSEQYIKAVLGFGYPNYAVTEIKNRYGIEINSSSAEQATQMAVWAITEYAQNKSKGMTYQQAIGNFGLGQTDACKEKGYEPVKLVNYLVRDAVNYIEGTRTLKLTKTVSETKNYFVVYVSIEKSNMVGGYSGTYKKLPADTVITFGKNIIKSDETKRTFSSDPSVKNGTDKIKLTIPKVSITDEYEFEFEVKSVRYPTKENTTITSWETKSGSYQPVTEVKNPQDNPSFPDPRTAKITFNVEKTDMPTGKLIKISEDGIVEGMKFQAVEQVTPPPVTDPPTPAPVPKVYTATTDSKGQADFGSVDPGEYEVSEVNVPDRYVIPESVIVDAGEISELVFENILKKIIISIHKRDSETGDITQGDAQLQGTIYGVYDSNGDQVDTIVIGAGNKGESGELPAGIYTVQELSAGVGYLVDSNVYTVNGSPKNQTEEYKTYELNLNDNVIKGSFGILKELNNPNENSEELIPATGVRFNYFLISNPTISYSFVLDEWGRGDSVVLPYGYYNVVEDPTTTPEGWIPVQPFTVFVSEHGKVYRYYLSDRVNAPWVKLIKKDIETDKLIPLQGTGFKIKDLKTGEFIKQYLPYPNDIYIDEFYTNEEGWLMMPEKLLQGWYELHEIQAPYGYYRMQEPIKFYADAIVQDPFYVECKNIAQKADIIIQKNGTVMTDRVEDTIKVIVKEEVEEPVLDNAGNPTFDEEGNPITKKVMKDVEKELPMLVPQYEETGLPFTEYTVTALEDIITPEGTLRMAEGETKVFMSDRQGIAELKGLYLGKYSLQETRNVNGYVIDSKIIELNITYTHQDEEVQFFNFDKYNVRQLPIINLSKTMSGGGSEKDVLFGLYTKNPIGSQYNDKQIFIPSDVMIDVYKIENGKGVATYNNFVPLGSYYFKEIQTSTTHILDENEYVFEFTNGKEVTVYNSDGTLAMNEDGTPKIEMKYDNTTETFPININNGKTIVNYPINPSTGGGGGGGYIPSYGNITVDKVRKATVTGLVGAEFKLEYANGNTHSTWVSNGKTHEIKNLSPGTYYLVETKAPEGYIISEEKIKIVVEANKTTEITVENDYTKVDFSKEDITTGKHIEGADMEITDINGDIIHEWTTGTKPERIEMLEPGDYILRETFAPDGYIIAEEVKFTVEPNGNIQKVVMKDDYYGYVKIIKSDSDTSELLEGAIFGIYGLEGNLLYSVTTSEVGKAIKKLHRGKYIVKETKAPASYQLDETEYEIEIKEVNQVIEMKVKNVKKSNISVPVEGQKPVKRSSWKFPHTGDQKKLLYAGIGLLVAGVGIVVGIKRNKKKKGDINE